MDGAAVIPSVSSSPCSLRYPHLPFSLARRSTKARIDRSVRGQPAVPGSGFADEGTDGDEGGGEVEEEVHYLTVAVGAAAQLAVAVHPQVSVGSGPGAVPGLLQVRFPGPPAE